LRVLLTGGYGCIGSWIVKNLIERGDLVWIYDLRQDTRRLELLLDPDQVVQARFLQGDVTDLSGLRSAIERQQISHVVHLAGLLVPVCRADPLLGARVNVIGTLAVFQAVLLAGAQIERLVYASSSAVFGPPDEYSAGPLGDDVPLRPGTHYGAFKVCNETNARVYFQDCGLSSIGLRPWTVYGVGRDFGMTSEPTKAIKSMALGREYRISYGGKQDLQLADDVAKVFVRCLTAPYMGANAYNIRGTVTDLPTFVAALHEADPDSARLISHGDKQLPIAYDLDDARLQRDLGPMPVTPLLEGVRRTLQHFKSLHHQGRLGAEDL
jgi:nucleoside-diphosphate-sugar epimerase